MAVKPPHNTLPLPPAGSSLRPSAPDMDWPLATTAHRKSKVLPFNFYHHPPFLLLSFSVSSSVSLSFFLPSCFFPPPSLLPPSSFLPSSSSLPPPFILLPPSSLPPPSLPPRVVMLLMALLYPIAFPIAMLLDCLLGKGHSTFFRRAGVWCCCPVTVFFYLLPPPPPRSPSFPFLSPLPQIYQSCKS